MSIEGPDPDVVTAATLDALARRVRLLEDRWEIVQLIASYGPAVDAGLGDVVAGMWVEDGVYDVDGSWVMRGRDEIRRMVASRAHQRWILGGAGHLMQLPVVEVDGDVAVARHHSQLVAHGDDGFVVHRVTANRWELVRTPDGWRATHRRSNVLDGRDVSRDVLAGSWTPDSPATAASATDGTTP